MVKPKVHSTKHYVQTSIETVTGGAVTNKIIALAVAVADKNTVNEIEEGADIKAIYHEYWLRSASTTAASGQAILYKTEGDTATPSTTEMAALGDWVNKKNIMYTTMGLYNDQDSLAIPIYKGWLPIPKGKQRFGLGDGFRLSVFSPTVDLHLCGFSLFKEYT